MADSNEFTCGASDLADVDQMRNIQRGWTPENLLEAIE